MVRGLMERVFNKEQLDSIFENHATRQYTRELLFSSIVDLMSLVVCGIYPSVNAAYRAKASSLNVSRTAVGVAESRYEARRNGNIVKFQVMY